MLNDLLKEQIDSVQSQGMTFTNNGQQFSLSIPDTGQVKSALSTLSGIIIEQDSQINLLKTSIVEMQNEFRRDMLEMKTKFGSDLENLSNENMVLKSSIVDAQANIKCLSFNLQGFVERNPLGNTKVKSLPKDHFYYSSKLKFPKSPASRWKWAVRIILLRYRLNLMGISYAKALVNAIADSSICKRLERLEEQLHFKEQSLNRGIKDCGAKCMEDIDHVKVNANLNLDIMKETVNKRFKIIDDNVYDVKSLMEGTIKSTISHLNATVGDIKQASADFKVELNTLVEKHDQLNEQFITVSDDVSGITEHMHHLAAQGSHAHGNSRPPSHRPAAGDVGLSLPDSNVVPLGQSPLQTGRLSGRFDGPSKKVLVMHKQKLMNVEDVLKDLKKQDIEVTANMKTVADVIKQSTLDPYNPDATWVTFDNAETPCYLSYGDLVNSDYKIKQLMMRSEGFVNVLHFTQSIVQLIGLDLTSGLNDSRPPTGELKECLEYFESLQVEIKKLLQKFRVDEMDNSAISSFIASKCGQYIEAMNSSMLHIQEFGAMVPISEENEQNGNVIPRLNLPDNDVFDSDGNSANSEFNSPPLTSKKLMDSRNNSKRMNLSPPSSQRGSLLKKASLINQSHHTLSELGPLITRLNKLESNIYGHSMDGDDCDGGVGTGTVTGNVTDRMIHGTNNHGLNKEEVAKVVEASMKDWHQRFSSAIAVAAATNSSALPAPSSAWEKNTHADDVAHSDAPKQVSPRREYNETAEKFPGYAFSNTGNGAITPRSRRNTHLENKYVGHGATNVGGGGDLNITSSKEFVKLQDTVDLMKKQIDSLQHNKQDADSDRVVLSSKVAKLEMFRVNDANSLDSAENSIRQLMMDIHDITRAREKEEEDYKREKQLAKIELKQIIIENINLALELKERGGVDSYATTRAMCLGCGRDSLIKHIKPATSPIGLTNAHMTMTGSPLMQMQETNDDNMSQLTGADAEGHANLQQTPTRPKSTTTPTQHIGGIIQFPVIVQPSSSHHVINATVPLIHPAINSQLNRGVGGINSEAEEILHKTISAATIEARGAFDAQRQLLNSSNGRKGPPKIIPSSNTKRVYDNLDDDGALDLGINNALPGKKSDRAAISFAPERHELNNLELTRSFPVLGNNAMTSLSALSTANSSKGLMLSGSTSQLQRIKR